jgi:hypothetical protein
MKRITSLSLILLTAGLLPSFSVQAERAIIFTPPQMGAPASRIGGGTRSIKQALQPLVVTEQIQLLASRQTGLSSLATPTLYWYASSIPPYSVEISVLSNDNKPLLKKNIGLIKTAGFQAIRLADYGVKLTAGQNYTWSVALITNPTQRNADLLANATIRYQAPSAPLSNIAQMSQSGYWYDAVAQSIETNSPSLQELLQQEDINTNNQ